MIDHDQFMHTIVSILGLTKERASSTYHRYGLIPIEGDKSPSFGIYPTMEGGVSFRLPLLFQGKRFTIGKMATKPQIPDTVARRFIKSAEKYAAMEQAMRDLVGDDIDILDV